MFGTLLAISLATGGCGPNGTSKPAKGPVVNAQGSDLSMEERQTGPAPAQASPAPEGKAKAGASTPLREIMIKVGRGPKSLTPTIERALREDEPAWDKIGEKTRELMALVALAAKYDPPRGSKESWTKRTSSFAESVAVLDRAVQGKDKGAALAAHEVVSNSCMACHREHRRRMGPPGGGGPGGPPRIGQILPGFLQDELGLNDDQKKRLRDLQKEAEAKLDGLLTAEQRKQLKEMREGFGRGGPGGPGGPDGPPPDGGSGGPPPFRGAGGFGGPPRPGQLLPLFLQERLNLTSEQTKQLEVLQKESDAKLAKVLTGEQAKQLEEMRNRFGRGRPGPGGRGPGDGRYGDRDN